MSEEQNSFLPW